MLLLLFFYILPDKVSEALKEPATAEAAPGELYFKDTDAPKPDFHLVVVEAITVRTVLSSRVIVVSAGKESSFLISPASWTIGFMESTTGLL